MIARATDFDPAKLREVGGQKLSVEEKITAEPQARGQMHERDLARVGRAAKHAFAKKGGADRDAI
jgi:hypothetical protein